MAHLTSVNIHLSGPVEPRTQVHQREGVPAYGSVDLDRKAYSSTIFIEDSTQAAQLAKAFADLAAALAEAEHEAAEAELITAIETASRDEDKTGADLAEAEQVTEDTSDHYPSTEGV